MVLCMFVCSDLRHHHHHIPARILLAVLLQSEILIEAERLTWFTEGVLPGHRLDRRLKLFLHLLLELVLCKGSLFALAVVRGVESVFWLLVVVSGR